MGIKIDINSHIVPVQIGEVELEFNASDENIKRFYESYEEIEKEMEAIKGNHTLEGHEEVKAIMRKGYDLILGEGTFDKLYSKYPSLITLVNAFMQVVIELEKAIDNMTFTKEQKKMINKYKKNKNKLKLQENLIKPNV